MSTGLPNFLNEYPNTIYISLDSNLSTIQYSLYSLALYVDPRGISHQEVVGLMRTARAFVQHSLRAPNGDSEGTPVAVLEAGAMGLSVISTRHAGIPEVVIEDQTGLLVDERDIAGMAGHMVTLAKDPILADELGRKAADRVRKEYNMQSAIDKLAKVLQIVARGRGEPT